MDSGLKIAGLEIFLIDLLYTTFNGPVNIVTIFRYSTTFP